MADSLDLFTGILLTVIGLVLVYGSIVYRLIDLILIIGVLITIFGLYKLLSAYILRILGSGRNSRGRNLRHNSKNDAFSRVMDGAKGVEDLVNAKLDNKDSSKSKSTLQRHDSYYDSDLDESSTTLDEYLSNSKPKSYAPKFEMPSDESKQVLNVKPAKDEKPKFKLPSIRKSNDSKKRSFGYYKEDQKESSPDTLYFTPNYEKPMKVTRRPKRKSKETINLSNAPKRSDEISKALASVGDAETIYDNEVSDDSYSLMPKTMDEELIMSIDEIEIGDVSEDPIYNLSQSENTLYNNVIYDDSDYDGVITPIYADEEYKEEHGISDDDLLEDYGGSALYLDGSGDEEDYGGSALYLDGSGDEEDYGGSALYLDESGDDSIGNGAIYLDGYGGNASSESMDYIVPEVSVDLENLPRPTSVASTNPIVSKKERGLNLSRPHRKVPVDSVSGLEVIPKPKHKVEKKIVPAEKTSEVEVSHPIPKIPSVSSDDGADGIPTLSELIETEETIKIDPNDPESLPIPKLLNSYVICEKGILTSQEAFEEVASHSKDEILLEAPTVKDMGERFLSNLSKTNSRVIIQEFDLEDISYVLLLSSLIKKGVEIKTLPSVDSFNLIGDTSHALLISNSVDEDDFEYGAVYDDRESVENIKELFESSWNLAKDLDISALVENN